MIYRCWNCGWRINQRTPGEKDNSRIGSHLLWRSHPFCSQYCIDSYKKYFQKSGDKTEAPISDWNEQGWLSIKDDKWTNWKTERKMK